MDDAPALFISHGSPTFALEPGLLGPKLGELAKANVPVFQISLPFDYGTAQTLRLGRALAPLTGCSMESYLFA